MTARTEDFERHRSLLFSIAYRMLGSVTDAEDIVQETYLRWQEMPDTVVRSLKSYLSAVVTRLSIDRLRSARAHREEYVGPWLPEPLVLNRVEEGADLIQLDESLSMAFLVLLESLNPVERAVFLLREVFDYEYEEISRIVGKSEANCRQITRRARQSVAARRPRFESSPEQEERLTQRFVDTCMSGDMEGLLELLSEDVTLWSDGGGKVAAASYPIHGPEGDQVPARSATHCPARILHSACAGERGTGRGRLRERMPHERGCAGRRERLSQGRTDRCQPGEATGDTPGLSELVNKVPEEWSSKLAQIDKVPDVRRTPSGFLDAGPTNEPSW